MRQCRGGAQSSASRRGNSRVALLLAAKRPDFAGTRTFSATEFLAPACRAVVEVDGGYHERRQAADARRERQLQRMGYRVLRLPAELVMRDLPVALGRIEEALKAGR